MAAIASVPVAVLRDAVGHQVSVTLMNGDEFRGKLEKVDDKTLGVALAVVLFRRADGFTEAMAKTVVPGSRVKYVVLPDFMKNAPFFAEIRAHGAAALGDGGLLEKLKRAKQGGGARAGKKQAGKRAGKQKSQA